MGKGPTFEHMAEVLMEGLRLNEIDEKFIPEIVGEFVLTCPAQDTLAEIRLRFEAFDSLNPELIARKILFKNVKKMFGEVFKKKKKGPTAEDFRKLTNQGVLTISNGIRAKVKKKYKVRDDLFPLYTYEDILFAPVGGVIGYFQQQLRDELADIALKGKDKELFLWEVDKAFSETEVGLPLLRAA